MTDNAKKSILGSFSAKNAFGMAYCQVGIAGASFWFAYFAHLEGAAMTATMGATMGVVFLIASCLTYGLVYRKRQVAEDLKKSIN